MRIFVAGATGEIGGRLVPMLVGAGHEVVGMTSSETRARQVEERWAPRRRSPTVSTPTP